MIIIPNQLLILWTQKLSLECLQCAKSVKLVALANASIKDSDIRLSPVKALESRLQKIRSEVAKQYSRLRDDNKTDHCKKTSHVTLFDGETISTTAVSTASTAVSTASTAIPTTSRAFSTVSTAISSTASAAVSTASTAIATTSRAVSTASVDIAAPSIGLDQIRGRYKIYISNEYLYTYISGSDFEKIKKRQKDRRLKIIRTQLAKFSAPLLETGLQVVSVELRTTGGQHVNLQLTPRYKKRIFNKNVQDNTLIPNVSYLLLKYGVSYEFYHEIAMLFKNLPRTYRVQYKIHM